ncbi:MAG: hypothetical protein R3D45_13585 [Rhizobiaceae bacterium]
MIMRVYRCTVVEGKEEEHRKFAFQKRHPSLSRKPGLIAFYAGKPVPGSSDRARCLVQIWESMEALTSALGEFWDQPMKAMPPEVRDVYDSATIEHYELADQFQIAE